MISFGGTPTVVWRRTGEICLVGFEFTMLTDWTREELLGKTKYIFEVRQPVFVQIIPQFHLRPFSYLKTSQPWNIMRILQHMPLKILRNQ